MRRRAVLLLLLFALPGMGASAVAAERPNLIFILADDLGYGDLSCFGSETVETPHLDALAAKGMRLTQFYAASAVCSPTRASVLTGRYPLRFDIRRHFTDNGEHLPRDTVTLPKLLAEHGYQTAHLGKWHLGGLRAQDLTNRAASIPGPHEHGFDYYQCQLEDTPPRTQMFQQRVLYRKGGTCLVRNDRRVGPDDPYYDDHWTDINGDEAVAQVEKLHATGEPFFLNLWFLATHTPYEPAPEPHWSRTATAGISEDQHRFRSMLAHMDAKIGQLVAKLKELGIEDNTLIIFTSDNGAAYEGQVGTLKGGKGDLHEGGIRVPGIAVWPGKIAPGTESDVLGHATDLLPTFCAAAGIELPNGLPIDGVNLLPHLTSRTPIERGTVFWQMDHYDLQRHYPKPKPYATEVVRRGRWKLLAKDGQPLELFDIKADLAEQHNLLDKHPQIVAELRAELTAWLAEPRIKTKILHPNKSAEKNSKAP